MLIKTDFIALLKKCNCIGVKMRRRILVAMLICSILPITLVSCVMYIQNSQLILKNEKNNMLQNLYLVNQDLESRAASLQSISMSIVIDSSIRQLMNIPPSLEREQNRRQLERYLQGIATSLNGIFDISIIDMNGTTYSVRSTISLPPDFKLKDSDLYKTAIDGNGNLVWLSDNSFLQAYVRDSVSQIPLEGIATVADIKDFYNNISYGVLIIVIKPDYFKQIYNLEYGQEKPQLYLVSDDGKIILDLADSDRPLEPHLLNSFSAMLDNSSIELSIDNKKNIVAYSKNNHTGWNLISIRQTSELVKVFTEISSTLFAVSALSILMSIIMSSLLSKNITKGIDTLIVNMEHVENGDLTVKINSGRRDEIGKLSRGFDNMVNKINELIKLRYEQELLSNKAKFEALQAQISPHFLYNTLDLINWLLIGKGEYDISNIIVALGDLLRYSISSKGHNATVDEEIQNVNNYILIQQARTKDLFNYKINVDESTKCILPKLTLQPIVENAIIHGFMGRHTGNLLEIKGYIKDDVYILEIIDNGIGMTVEQLQKVFIDSEREINPKMKRHIGLHNVDHRIRLLYGQEYGLSIESEYGQGTIVIIRLPICVDRLDDTNYKLL